jgi:5-methylthioadenosine/S-adenosylhomocysteine deaminase
VTERVLLRGGCVLTLGTKTPNLTIGDVLLADGLVSAVGRDLDDRGAEVVDATDTIVMPGFVDAHRHAWTSLFRNLGDDVADRVPPSADLRGHHGVDDIYAATLIGVLGALEAGITTVVDWADGGGDDAVEAALRAHADAGVRSVYVLDEPSRGALDRAIDRAGPDTTIAVGSGLGHDPDLGSLAERWALARELGLRIVAHADRPASRPGVIATLAGLLGADVTLVHHTRLDERDLDAVSSAGAAFCLAPSSEMAEGQGTPPIQQLIDHDIRPALGVGTEGVAPGDMFAQMRATISMQHALVFDRKLAGKAGLPKLMTTRDVIRFATSEGARAAGLGDVTGSIEPGRRADIVVLRADRPNVWPINDAIGAVVWGMDTSNVDRVLVGGRTLMRDGVLTADVAHARTIADEARDRVAQASGLVVGVGGGAS